MSKLRGTLKNRLAGFEPNSLWDPELADSDNQMHDVLDEIDNLVAEIAVERELVASLRHLGQLAENECTKNERLLSQVGDLERERERGEVNQALRDELAANEALRAQVATLTAERDEARNLLREAERANETRRSETRGALELMEEARRERDTARDALLAEVTT